MDGAHSLAERVREAVASAPFPITGHKDIHITISIGVATYSSDRDTKETLIATADNALYEAKQHCRNCVFMASV
jgi:diguanylate cyclase (GGDEF)-like protein